MGSNLLVAFAAARAFVQVFHLPGPSQSPLNLWLPLARHLPEACAALCGVLAAQVVWLRRAYARGGTVWSRRSREDVDVLRQALLDVSY